MSKQTNTASTTHTPTIPTTGIIPPVEVVDKLSAVGVVKCNRKPLILLVLAILSGFYLGIACIATSSVTFSITNVGVARMATALLFPFGLIMIIFTGAELYTGNNLIFISYLDKKVTFAQMIKSWLIVYMGNFIGCTGLAFLFQFTRNIHLGGGQWAHSLMGIAASKNAISWVDGLLLGIFCNILVTVAVFMVTSTTDPIGRMMSALVPVSLFVMAGLEHCIANMFYIPMGIFLASTEHASTAVDISMALLTFPSFLLNNLLPVTIGNTVGGILLSSVVWYANRKN